MRGDHEDLPRVLNARRFILRSKRSRGEAIGDLGISGTGSDHRRADFPRWTCPSENAIIGDNQFLGAMSMKQPMIRIPLSVCWVLAAAGTLAISVLVTAADMPEPQFSYALFDGRSLDG